MEANTLTIPLDGGLPALTTRDLSSLRVHLIGIGGSGMAGLAALLLRRGATVSGSDRAASAAVCSLRAGGAQIAETQGAAALPATADLVVASAAIPGTHPELIAARQRGWPVLKYAELLGALMRLHEGIALSGTHGKSTTTAWTAFVLRRAGLDPSFVVGADVEQLGGGSGAGDGRHFIAEACEYDRSFLNLRPRQAAILNIEEDHLDYYPDLSAIRAAFAEFAALLPADGRLVYCADDEGASTVAPSAPCERESYGFGPDADWSAADLRIVEGVPEFTIMERGASRGRVRIGLAGRHNALNALAVTALARGAGVEWEPLRAGLAAFGGARRRLELRGRARGVTVADDYAHHPTEIQATLAAARERFAPRRVWCVFQPHQHSRTRFLLNDFARSFSAADHVVVPDIYFVRDSERDRELICAEELVERIRQQGGDAVHVAGVDAIVDHLMAGVADGDLVLTMGAGDIWKAADELLRRLC